MHDLPSLKQIGYFLALAETGNFRLAADKCGISQPSMSVQLTNLEKRLGVKLVERRRAKVVLTAAGREAEARGRLMVEAARNLVDWFDARAGGLGGAIRFGASTTLGPYLLPHVIARLHADHPHLSLFVEDAAPKSLVEGLVKGEHDFILVQLPVGSGDFTVARLFREPLELVVARDHPFAGKDLIEKSDLRGMTVLSLGNGYPLRQQVDDICIAAGARLRNDYHGTSLDALRLMAGMGMGVAFLPALYVHSEVRPDDADVKVVPLQKSRPLRSIGLVARSGGETGEAFTRMASLIQSVARSLFGGVLIMEERVNPAAEIPQDDLADNDSRPR